MAKILYNSPWKEGSFVDSNFQFLAQAVEVLNRELCPAKKPMDEKRYKEISRKILDGLPEDVPKLIRSRIASANSPSLRDRVQEMLSRFESWFKDDETSEDFARKVSDMRSYFTHYSEISQHRKQAPGEFCKLSAKLENLILLPILTFIGCDDDRIKQTVGRSQRLQRELDKSQKLPQP